MLARIEKGEAVGILAWHPDRLARNSVDGGQIIYMVDIGVTQELKSPTFWFDPTPQGKFMLSIAFGQSKDYQRAWFAGAARQQSPKIRILKIGGRGGIRTLEPPCGS